MANKPLTQDQLAKVEEKLKTYMANKQSWVKRYGKDAESVMRGRAISTVKKETEQMNKQKLKELVKTSLTKEAADSNLKDSVKKTINASGYNEKDFQIISEPNNPNSIELRSGGDQYWAQLPEDLLSSLENEFNVVEDFLEDEDTLPLYYYMVTPKMNEAKKSFPDLTGDGKVTRADILKGRGVELKEGNDFDGTGLIVVGRTQIDNNEIADMVDEGDYYGVWNTREGYWFFPENEETIDSLETELSREFNYRGINARFEGQFNESMNEDLDLGHQDNEPHMIKGELYRIGKYAMELYQMVDEFEGKGEVDFPAWWQSKITTSMNNMVSAKHYLDFELKEPTIDAMVSVASDEEVIDENISKEETLAGKIAKALKDKANKDSSDQTNLKQARTALNKGNMDAAKKIAKPYLDEKKLTSAETIAKKLKENLTPNKEEGWLVKSNNSDTKYIVVHTSEVENRSNRISQIYKDKKTAEKQADLLNKKLRND